MKKISKEAVMDCKIISDVIDGYRMVQDRVKKLTELGYEVRQDWVGSGGVGTIRAMHGMKGIQISSPTARCRYAGLAYVAYKDSMAELTEGRRCWQCLGQ